MNDIKFWVSKQGGTKDDRTVYETNVRALLQTESVDIFENVYAETKQSWSQSFVNYFEKKSIPHYKNTFCPLDFGRRRFI